MACSMVRFRMSTNIISFEFNVQDLILEPLSITSFAGEIQISHELHLDLHDAFSFAFLASAPGDIERKISRLVSPDFG